MFRKIALFFVSVLVSYASFAQDALTQVNNGVDLNVIYRNEATIGVLAHSNGFGLSYRRSKHMTADRKRVWEYEIVNMDHPKEIKTINPAFDNSKGYYYGELNSIIIPRVGFGYQNVLYRKAERKSVEIRYSTYIGISLALAKPVYLEILNKTANGTENTLTTERYDPNNPNHTQGNIYGSAPYFQGVDETKVYPGMYGKVGLSFEYGGTRADVKILELGMTLDAYPKVIPQMAFSQNYQLFPSLYISLIYGRKWF